MLLETQKKDLGFELMTPTEQSVISLNGTLGTSLILSDVKGNPQVLLLAVPKVFGTLLFSIALKDAAAGSKNLMSTKVQVFILPPGIKSPIILASADLTIETDDANKIKRVDVAEGDIQDRKKIDWGHFVDCVWSNCKLDCLVSRIWCLFCVGSCVYDSITEE